ncbi:MAG: serine hydrolase [Marinoscillum sp.]
MAYRTIIFVLFIIFFQNVCLGKTDSLEILKKLQKDIDSIVNNAISKEAFPGCVIYASYQGKPFVHMAFGFHTYDSVRSVYSSDIYDLASLTKVTASTVALMRLFEQGLIDLEAPIKDYVDGLGWSKVGRVTIREALAHQGGIKSWIKYYEEIQRRNQKYRNKTISNTYSEEYPFKVSENQFLHKDFYQKIKKMIRKSEVTKNPNYVYSGLFFYLVPEIIYKLTGEQFDEFLSHHFYDSMDLETLGFNPTEKFDLLRIVPTEIDTFFRHSPIHGVVHDEGAILMKGVSGNAGLFSNARDLGKFWEMLLTDGWSGGYSYLKPATLELFTAPQYSNFDNRRGLGFDRPLLVYDSIRSSVAKSASVRSFGHSGYTGTLAWADPDYDLVFIFLSNRVYPNREQRALYDLNVRPEIHQLIYDYLEATKEN